MSKEVETSHTVGKCLEASLWTVSSVITPSMARDSRRVLGFGLSSHLFLFEGQNMEESDQRA